MTSSKIKVLSLCDGISAGLVSLKDLGLEVEYHAVEIDKFPRSISDSNFPGEVIRWSDDVTAITKEDIETYGPFDWIIFGSPCFVRGTKVITSEGYKNIEDVKVGDNVLTHKGRYKKVLKIGFKTATTRAIKFSGMKEIVTTDEHPFLGVKEDKKTYPTVDGKRTKKRNYSKEYWEKAEDIKKNFYGKLAHVEEMNSNPRNLDEETCWIIGRFIAGGHLRKSLRTEKGREEDFQYQVILSIGSLKLEKLKEKVTIRKFSAYPYSQSAHRVVFSSKELVELLISMGFVNGAENKHLPEEIFSLPLNLRKILLEGYMSGDGHYSNSTDTYRCISISELLILGIQRLVYSVYGTLAGYCFSKKEPTCVIQGRTVNQKSNHILRYKTHRSIQSNYIEMGKYVYTPNKSNETTGKAELVFNLEVEDDNTYTANNLVVHNCQSLSVSGNGKGLDGASGLLFDCLKVLNWCHESNSDLKFLIENVKMKKEFLGQFDDAVEAHYSGQVYRTLINSRLLSAQNRERYYWTNFPVSIPQDSGEYLSQVLENIVPKEMFITPKNVFRISESSIYWDTANKGGLSSQQDRAYSVNGKSPTVPAARTDGKMNIFQFVDREKSHCLDANYHKGTSIGEYIRKSRRKVVFAYSSSGRGNGIIEDRSNLSGKANTLTTGDGCGGGLKSVNLVGELSEKDIVFRKLTVRECARLQKLPENYSFEMTSKTQAYKAIGNSWTVSVIVHIMSCAIGRTEVEGWECL